MEYVRKEKYRGLPGLRFELDMGSPINIKECFCRDEEYCPPKGAMDLFRCNGKQRFYVDFLNFFACVSLFVSSIPLGIPLVGTLPHFFRAEQLLDNVASGLNPEYEKHVTFSVFEIVSEFIFLEIFPLNLNEFMILDHSRMDLDDWHTVTGRQTNAVQYGS